MSVRSQAVGGVPDASRHSLSVAVVGAGAAGLAAARELLRAGHRATVFEAGGNVGGVWAYSDEVEDHPLGLGSRHCHGSMYAGLRTNLPRQVMGFAAFPFDAAFPGSADPRQFCSHQEVQAYLEAFADRFDLRRHVRLHTKVQRVAPVSASASSSTSTWEVTIHPAQQQQQQQAEASSSGGGSSTERFDAVVVANGHYSVPRFPRLPGADTFPGLVMHSHNYRRPEGFMGQTVVLVGASSSGVDVAEELARAGAARVYLCARVWENPLTGEVLDAASPAISSHAALAGAAAAPAGAAATLAGGILKAANLEELHADGSVTLADGSRIEGVDAVMFCTGYAYSFPFLPEGVVSTEDNRVSPLYQHMWPPSLAPGLSFIGLPFKIVPFPQMELQARWVAAVLAGAAALPPHHEMEAAAAAFYASLDAAGTPVRYTHRMSGGVQWQYARFLAAQCGEPAPPAWREAMYNACGQSRKLNGERYRDEPLPGAAEAEAEARAEAARVRQADAAAVATA